MYGARCSHSCPRISKQDALSVEIGQGLHGQKPVDDIAKFWRERGHSVEEGPWREMRINIDDHNRTSGGGDSLCLP